MKFYFRLSKIIIYSTSTQNFFFMAHQKYVFNTILRASKSFELKANFSGICLHALGTFMQDRYMVFITHKKPCFCRTSNILINLGRCHQKSKKKRLGVGERCSMPMNDHKLSFVHFLTIMFLPN